MKHKKTSKLKRTIFTVAAVVCTIASFNIISADAASYTREDILPSSGYVVGTTAAYSGTTATCTGKVISGPPITITISGKGYYGTQNDVVVKTLTTKSKANATTYSRDITSTKTAIGCRCTATYSGNHTYIAKKGIVSVS